MKMNDKNYFNFSNTQIVIERCLIWPVVHTPPSSYIANSIAVFVFNVILVIAGSILNSLVVFSFWKSAKLRSKVCYFATMVLCSTDLAVVVVVQPMFVYKVMSGILGTSSCLYESFYDFVSLSICGMSFWNLFLANIERYLAVVHPIWHRVNVTKRRFLLSCVCCCVFSVATPVIMVFWSLFNDIIAPLLIGIVFCATIFIYISILVGARRRLLKTKLVKFAKSEETLRHSQMSLWRELKLAKSYFLVVGLTFICYVPFGVNLTREPSWYETNKKHINLVEVYGWLWVHTFTLMMSALNCVAFFWTNRGLRKEASKIIKKCFSPGENERIQLLVSV